MEEMSDVAPAHNPPYIAAMRLLSEKLPEIPLVAAFETGFHQTIPDRNRYYAVPYEWAEKHHVQRWGFHGASHRYIAGRTAELLGRDDLRIISCHLGGSSSLCAIRNGQSVATQHGHEPAERAAAEQPRRRFRSVRPAGADGADRQVARPKCSTILADAERAAGPERRQRRRARSGRGRRARQRPGAAGARRVHRRRFGIIWARIWSNWAAPTRSCSPAASARTASTFAPPFAADLEALGIELDPSGQRRGPGRSADQRRRQPHADLGRADERRDCRRPASAEHNYLSTADRGPNSHVHRQSHRQRRGHAKSRLDGRPQAADRRAVSGRRRRSRAGW